MKRSIRFVALLVVASTIFFYQCGTEKNTPIRQTYHNLTSYYNILFNGKESFNEGIKRYTGSYQYDFTRILPLFIYGNNHISQNIQPQMGRTIEKCSKLIRLHSISSKPEKLKNKGKLTKEEKEYYNKSEYNRFVDDAYLLMGKAYFWEMEFETAAEVLDYASREFKNELIKHEAKIWLSRCYIETNQFREAGKILKELEQDKKIPEELKEAFFTSYADYHIKQKQHIQAIPYLEKAISHADEKEKKVKYTFILAQLYEEVNQPNQAFNGYEKVIDMNPSYKMEFNAKLERAWLYKLNNQNGKKVKDELLKMLQDDKNKEYYDQIYFALGKIALEGENLSQALDYYKQSVAYNNKNKNQKGLSYLSMADIYFQKKNYADAQAYYDSALTSLESDYPGYTDLYIKTQNLTKLVTQLNTIERQDSLQKVAGMGPAEREQLISDLIEKHQEEERQKKEAQQNQRNYQAQLTRNNNRQTRNSNKWYFYSNTAVQRGRAEFTRRWGERELEDNWRISSKSQADFGNFETQQERGEEKKQQFSRTNKQYYLQDLPLTDSAMKASHNMIKEAYFNLGKIYMNDLNNINKAIEAFQKLNERYPDNPFKLSAYYNLYKLYKQQDNVDQTEKYKNKIFSEFPESNHAKVLKNPDYFKELEDEKRKSEKLYAETLDLYRNNKYKEVLNNCQKATKNIEDIEYLSKFKYLKALSIGQTQDIISFRNSLQSLVKDFPDTEVGQQANDILAYLKKTELQQINQKFLQNKAISNNQKESSENKNQQDIKASAQETRDSLYTFNKKEPYYFVIIANSQKIDLDRLKFELINFNLDYFLQKDYNISSDQFNEFFNIITLRRLENYDVAKNYYELLNKKEERVFSEINSNEYRYFYISVKNYITLLDKKSIIEYIHFFKKDIL